jgi:putative ABC transport system permease protein
MIDSIRQDFAYALRTLGRNVGFAALVIGGLALGIGANASIYSLIDAVLVRKLPVPHPDELTALGITENIDGFGGGTPGAVMYSYPLYRDVRDARGVFVGLTATGRTGPLDVRLDTRAAEPEHPHARFVSGNYFAVLEVPAALGRTLGPADDEPGAPPSATISYAYWTRRFHNDPSVVGRTVLVDGTPVAITGIAARGFDGEVVGQDTDLWLALGSHDLLERTQRVLEDRTAMWLLLIGRAEPGMTLAQVRQRIVPIIRRSIFANATPRQLRRLANHALDIPISSAARGFSRARARFAAPLDELMIAVALLLGIVCVNVANLLFARGIARRRELAIRTAMGADRRRIVRQLLTECLVMAAIAAAAAIIVAWWASRALVVVAAGNAPLELDVDPNARVLLFTAALAVSSILLFGVAPSLRSSRVDLAASARVAGRSITSGARIGFSMIVAQVALSLVLLASALTLVHGIRAALSTDLGFDRDHLLVAQLGIEKRGYTPSQLTAVVRELRDRTAAIPGVRAVTLSENGLFSGTDWSSSIDVPGSTPRAPDDSLASTDAVGAGYANGIGAHLLAGRDLTTTDETDNASSILVNATFARFYFPRGHAVGHIVAFGPNTVLRIVGVVADIRGQSLEAPQGHRARRIYYPYLHGNDTTRLGEPSELHMLVRTTGAPENVAASVRAAVASVDRQLSVNELSPLSSLIRDSIHEEQLAAQIATSISALALLMAAIGLFGVMSYSVARRTSEIGVRVALGARGADIGRMVLREAMRPVALGIGLGLPLVWVSVRLLQQHLTVVGSADPASMAWAIGVLSLCAALAAALPARRASRVEPAEALRQDL